MEGRKNINKKYEIKDLDYNEIKDESQSLIIKELFETFRKKLSEDITSQTLMDLIIKEKKDVVYELDSSEIDLNNSIIQLKHYGLWDEEYNSLKNPITAYYHPDYKNKKDYFAKRIQFKSIEINYKYWLLILSDFAKNQKEITDLLLHHIRKVNTYNSEMDIKAIHISITFYRYDGGERRNVGSGEQIYPIDLKHNQLYCRECHKWLPLINNEVYRHHCDKFKCEQNGFIKIESPPQTQDIRLKLESNQELKNVVIDLEEMEKVYQVVSNEDDEEFEIIDGEDDGFIEEIEEEIRIKEESE